LAILECRNFAAFQFGVFSGCTLQGKVPSDFSHVNTLTTARTGIVMYCSYVTVKSNVTVNLNI